MILNELTPPGLAQQVAPTDCRLRPDQHALEEGLYDEVHLTHENVDVLVCMYDTDGYLLADMSVADIYCISVQRVCSVLLETLQALQSSAGACADVTCRAEQRLLS